MLMFGQLVVLYLVPPLFSSIPQPAAFAETMRHVFLPVFAGTILAEAIIQGVAAGRRSRSHQLAPENSEHDLSPILVVATTLAVFGTLLSAALGVGAYGSTGEEAGGLVAQLAKFLMVSQTVTVALACLQLSNGIKVRASYACLVVLAVANIYMSLRNGFLITLALYAFTVLALGLILRAITWRATLAVVLTGFMVTPILYGARNEVREDLTGAYFSAEPIDRIRQDILLSLLAYAPPSAHFELQSELEMARYAIPKPLDPGRSAIDAGRQFSQAQGSTATSSSTFTQPGNIYYLRGQVGVGIVYWIVASVASLLVMRGGPYAITVLTALVSTMVWVGGTYPESIAAFFQTSCYSLVTLLLISAFAAFLGRVRRPRFSERSLFPGSFSVD